MKSGFILIVTLLFSISLYLLAGDRNVKRAFFFPEIGAPNRALESKVSGEGRVIPSQKTAVENIRLVIEEVILGPINHSHGRLVSQKVKLLSLVLSRGVLYLNLSGIMLEKDPQVLLPVETQIQAMVNTLLFNFPFLKKVYVFIDGQIPDFSFEHGQEAYNFADGVSYSPVILK
jgi:hypothetical protein